MRWHGALPDCCAGTRESWRARYGEEFAELLIADISERPRSWRRTADVARERDRGPARDRGALRCTLEASAQVRASLTSLGCCVAVFIGLRHRHVVAAHDRLAMVRSRMPSATTRPWWRCRRPCWPSSSWPWLAAVPVLWSAGSRLARDGVRAVLGRQRSSRPAR